MSFMHGAPLLVGDNTIPGVQLSKELKELIPKVLQSCREWGLDFYPTVVQLLTYDEISEIAAYGGFPVRFPHWSFGMEYEELQRGYEFGMHKIYEMVINCLEVSAPVLTMRGSVEACSVRVGDDVIVGNDTRKVVAVKRQKASKTKNISLKNGQTLACTPNHKWRILSDNGLIWKESSEILAGDLIIGSDSFATNWDVPSIDWTSDSVVEQTRSNVRVRLKEIEPKKTMTLQLAELLGVLTGDGSVGVKGSENILSVAVDKKHADYAQHVANLFFNVFGVEASIKEKPNCLNVVLCSKFAVSFLDSIGLLKGVTHKQKRIPEMIWSSPPVFRAAYLRGLFDTDGYVSDYVGFSCYNKHLANDVQVMLTEMGIQSCLTFEDNGIGNIHVVELRGIWADLKFSERIGFVLQHKQNALKVRCERKSCRNGGLHIPYLQNELIEWAKNAEITTYNNPSLGRSIKRFENQKVGSNALSSFVQRAEQSGLRITSTIKELLSNPIFEVKDVVDGDLVETVDIALDHDAHDFVAYGLITHNTNPCYIYNLSSNTLVDHLTVVAHATGHNDFFKNNIHFGATDTNMLNKMANHGTRIRKYMARWGKERVTEFLDWVMRLETLIDGAEAWTDRVVKEKNIRDQRHYRYPRRLNVDKDRMYMEPFINTRDFLQKENSRVAKKDIADEIGVFKEPTKNILGYLRDNAPLKPWQADIVSMLYEEAMYFFPQRQTKVMNEGWASTVDSVIMAEQGLVALGQQSHDVGIIEYAQHKMGVLGGKYSTNPYKLGYYLFKDIRERWDKGQFGSEWDDCSDIRMKENWDKGTNLGKEKIFEVRKYYDDFTFLHEFFTEDFCREQEYFHWKHYPNGEFRIENRDFKEIKRLLMRRHLNGGLPDIRLTEPNYRGKGAMFLQHYHDGRNIYEPYIADVLMALRAIWHEDVYLSTSDDDGNEKVFCCHGSNSTKDVEVMTRKEHLKRQ
jgi:stage V sporulation protein R